MYKNINYRQFLTGILDSEGREDCIVFYMMCMSESDFYASP